MSLGSLDKLEAIDLFSDLGGRGCCMVATPLHEKKGLVAEHYGGA
jgi:hypothetical protein